MADILLIEAFYGGSHKQLIDTIVQNIGNCVKFTLPAKKWHWRARTSSLHFSEVIPPSDSYRVLFTSSVLSLAELTALRPDLARLKKVVYFHENQLVYPVRKQQDRDFQYGYNQILSCLVADEVVFNSNYNKDSFLASIDSFLKLIPDHRPRGLVPRIAAKCRVAYFPLAPPPECLSDCGRESASLALSKNSRPSPEEACVCVTDTASASVKEMVPRTLDSLPSVDTCPLCRETVDGIACQCLGTNVSKNAEENLDASHTALKCASASKGACEMESSADTRVQDVGELSSGLCVNESGLHLERGRNSFCGPGSSVSHGGSEPTLHIVWPHRWEHDKDPEAFFSALYSLQDSGLSFRLSVLGEQFTKVPDVFAEAKDRLESQIVNWGYLASKSAYLSVLASAHVVVSTAQHEFFGVAMLEAVQAGCFPLCPRRLVYPEIFPEECLYGTQQQLVKKLRHFCQKPYLAGQRRPKIDLERFSWRTLEPTYRSLLSVPT